GSTLVSQFIDSFVVLFIAFYLGAGWKWQLVLAVGMVNYTYKFLMAVLMTPVIYGVHHLMDNYLGHDVAHQMRQGAMGNGTPLSEPARP
ncbi:MAG TPA: VUT family protein, partial [Candidatus Obscuribacterales bacterium]